MRCITAFYFMAILGALACAADEPLAGQGAEEAVKSAPQQAGGSSSSPVRRAAPSGRIVRNTRWRGRYENQGLQVGRKAPDLTVRALDNGQLPLAEAWAGGPALVVTASLTCPVSRGRMSELEAIRERFADKVNVVILYTLEAHPEVDPSPYSGKEWLTGINWRDGVLYRQPTSMDERMKLARAFRDRFNTSIPIVVDTIGNDAWRALGGGANMGLLFRRDGTLAAKSGWFDGTTMKRSIEALLEEGSGGSSGE